MFFPLFIEFPDTNNLIFININEFFGTFLCFLQNVIFPIKKKFLKRNDSRTAVIFKALKMKCSLVICRIAIKQEMSLFQTFGLPLFGPIGFHEQDWLLAMTLQKRDTFAKLT